MQRKYIVFVSIIMILIVSVSCSPMKNQYVGQYITFNYPKDWELKINESIDGTNIDLENEIDFDFLIDLKMIKNKENEEEVMKTIEEEFAIGYQNAQKFQSIEVMSYKNTNIDGEIAKEMILEIQKGNVVIEQLYYLLKEDMGTYDEVNNYLAEYKEPEKFISEINESPQPLEDLKALLLKLELESEKEQSSKMLADSFINNIYNLLENEDNTLIKQRNILSIKGKTQLNIYLQGEIDDYQNSEELAQNIVNSVKFVE